jgi:hypothetical protein
MLNAQLEELESRQLLNGNSISAQFVPPQPSAPSTFWITERLAFVDYAGRLELFGWGWSTEPVLEIGRLRSVAFGGYEGVGRDTHALRAFSRQGPTDASVAETVGDTGRAGTNYPSADPIFAGGRETVPPNFVVPATAPTSPAGNAASGATLPGILLQRLNPAPLSFSFDNPVNARNPVIDDQGWFAVRPSTPAPRVREESLGHSGNLGEEERATSGTPTTDQVRQDEMLPSPKVSDLLAILPFFDDGALDVGIRQFLAQLERLCPRLTNDPESSALWPWVVAVMAAATAGEIARRELKRPSAASAGERNELDCLPTDHLFAG